MNRAEQKNTLGNSNRQRVSFQQEEKNKKTFTARKEPQSFNHYQSRAKPQLKLSKDNQFPNKPQQVCKMKEAGESIDLPMKDKPESVHSCHNKYVPMQSSYVTVLNAQKEKLSKLKVEKQLYNQQQANAKKIVEFRNLKKEERKNIYPNMVKINADKEQYKSVKMRNNQQQELYKEQSIKNQHKYPVKQVKNSQIITIKQKQFQKLSDGKIEKIFNSSLKQQKHKKSASMVESSTKSIIVNKNDQEQGRKCNKKQAEIIKIQRGQIKLNEQKQVKVQYVNKLSNSFFYDLHYKIDQLQMQRQGRQQKYQSYRQNQQLQVSQTLIDTQNILHAINNQLKQIQLFQPEQEIEQNSDQNVQKQLSPKHQGAQVLIDESLYESKQENQIFSEREIFQQFIPLRQQCQPSPKRIPRLSFRSSLIYYQISQNAPQLQAKPNGEQQQQLSNQINLLKQVISGLKIERIKHQASQDSQKKYEKERTLSNNTNRQQLTSTPNLKAEKNHKTTRSNIGNFTESIVAQFSPHHFRSVTTNLSGKIIRRKIQSEKQSGVSQKQTKQQQTQRSKPAKKQEQIKQVINQTEINDLSHPSHHKSKQFSESNGTKKTQLKINESNQKIFSKINKQIINSNSQGSYPIQCQPENQVYTKSVKQTLKHKQFQENQDSHNQSSIKKKLLVNFQQMQKESNKNTIHKNQYEPKVRANNDNLFKTNDIKTSFHLILNKKNCQTNIKNLILTNEALKSQRKIFQATHQTDSKSLKDSKDFRIRHQSQLKNGRINSSKSLKQKIQVETISKHIPPIISPSQLIINQVKQSQKNRQKQALESLNQTSQQIKRFQTFTVQTRNINFNISKIPPLPQPPNSHSKILQLSNSIKQMNAYLTLDINQLELSNLTFKKYKNCLIVDLPTPQKQKLVWYYTGKLYIGYWNETSMIKSGQGIEFIPSKYYYQGQFMNDRRNGSGTMVNVSGNIYEGQWFEGEKNGRGKFYDSAIKLNYQGEWKNGKKQGYGYYCVQKQSKYEGTFSDNFKEGFGTEEFVTGDSYKGEYSKGRFHGEGKYIWASGDYYEGNFFQGCKHGRGRLTLKTGQIYAGHYKHDLKSGQGRYMWANGCIFDGKFEQDKKNGKGLLTYPDGREVQGIWKKDKLTQFQVQFSNIEQQGPKSGNARPATPNKILNL